MSVEALSETAAWPITLPPEPPRDRALEARRPDGTIVSRWQWTTDSWVRVQDEVRWRFSWPEVVARCLHNGWSLRSLPKTGVR
jgi:hypothetical protein